MKVTTPAPGAAARRSAPPEQPAHPAPLQLEELDLIVLARIAGGMNKNDLIADTKTRAFRA